VNNSDEKILDELSKIVREVIGKDDVSLTKNSTANDVPGWDSLSHVQILYKCELTWGIRLTLKELSSLNNVGDLVEIIVKYLENK